jgi:hypothetical protein
VTNRYQPVILETWRYYAKKYRPEAFIDLVEEKATAESWKRRTVAWWNTLFKYSKSFIVVMLVIYILTPSVVLKASLLDVAYYAMWAVILMFVCTAIESARVYSDVLSELSRATQVLSNEENEAPIPDAEFWEATKDIHRPAGLGDWFREDWRGKFSCVRLTIIVPYIGTVTELIRGYRDWRTARLKKRKAKG